MGSEAPQLITVETASRIWGCHREIEAGQKLLAEITDALKRGADPTPLDPFGRRGTYQLGIPSGDNGHRLFGVSPSLARYIIESHIANKRSELAEACVVARMELDGALPAKAEAQS
jgi:hypothetical protein